MKIVFFKSRVILLSLLFLISCSKENQKETPIGEYNNPYKSIGVMHNDILKDVLTNTALSQKGVSHKELLYAVKKSYEKIANKSITGDDNISDSLSLAFVDLIFNERDITKMNNFMYENGINSSVVRDKMNELKTILLDQNEGNVDFANAYNKIVQFEWSIVNDNKLTEGDRTTVLKLIAIAKESCKFWYENKDVYFTGQKSFADWLIISVADASSFWCPWFAALASTAFWVATGVE